MNTELLLSGSDSAFNEEAHWTLKKQEIRDAYIPVLDGSIGSYTESQNLTEPEKVDLFEFMTAEHSQNDSLRYGTLTGLITERVYFNSS